MFYVAYIFCCIAYKFLLTMTTMILAYHEFVQMGQDFKLVQYCRIDMSYRYSCIISLFCVTTYVYRDRLYSVSGRYRNVEDCWPFILGLLKFEYCSEYHG